MSTTPTELEAFQAILNRRHACRGFKPEPIPQDVIRDILADAQKYPSNCNTQPVKTHIVSGAKLAELKAAYIANFEKNGFGPVDGKPSQDFAFSAEFFTGAEHDRLKNQGKTYFEAISLERDNKAGRANIMIENFNLYGAPHVALFWMKNIGDGNVRQAGDVGHYAMTFMWSVVAHGYSCLPQTVLGMSSIVPRQLFNIPDDEVMLFGVAFGREDEEDAANKFRMERAPIDDVVVFHE